MALHVPSARRAVPWRPRTTRVRVPIVAVVLIVGALSVASVSTLAVFSNTTASAAIVSTGRIFPGVRTTSGFVVHDASGGGAEVDRSSTFAVAGDGRTTTSMAWATAFAANRYLQFDLNAPLPAAVGASGVTFRLLVGSTSATGTECGYVEVRRISDDGLVATYGSPGSPLGCVTGTTPATLTLALPAVATTDAANDLRVRIYGRDSDGAASTIDQAVVTGSTPYSTFTLYPVRFTDAASSTPVSTPWELDGP